MLTLDFLSILLPFTFYILCYWRVQEIENLRLELSSRPTIKQWSEKERALREAENKLRDIIVMRKESAELEAARKHVGAKERIQIDKHNYQMGLMLLDSLPQAVAKGKVNTALSVCMCYVYTSIHVL